MRDVLLHIGTYPDPTPVSAIDQTTAFAENFGCRLSVLAIHVDIPVPQNWLADKMLDIGAMAATEEGKSLDAARAVLKHFEAMASPGIRGDAIIATAVLAGRGATVARHARTRDLCIVPMSSSVSGQRLVAEDVIFESGRPILVFDPDRAPLSKSLRRIVIAWDGSRSAARAAADALPLLKRADSVRVVTIVGEKPSAILGLGGDLVRHLRIHEVEAVLDEVEGADRPIGASMDAYLSEHQPELIVMGAYGNPKLKQFILGGATSHVLSGVRVPVLMSH